MNEADKLWDEGEAIFAQWGLQEIPFSENAGTLEAKRLHQVFTGRTNELRQVFNLIRGQEPKRILVYGWIGIGKTAFLREVLGVLQRRAKKVLTAYVSLPPNMDLATASLVALAREMEDDEWAQHQLNQMGLLPRKRAVKKTGIVRGGVPGTGAEKHEETIPVSQPQYPALSFEDLLERAYTQYDRVVIAIDDLDKHDPARLRQLLRDAQGLLKGKAWFMLTGHPSGLTRDLLTRELGLFDLAIKLTPLDQETTYRMLVNYLNSARPTETRREIDDPRAVWPFTPETASELCRRSDGVPRYLNRLGTYTLLKAAELRQGMITADVLTKGVAYAEQRLRGQQGLTARDIYILELVLDKKLLSDESVSLADLERVRAREFGEIMPILEKLVQHDLLRRIPSDRAIVYAPSPLISDEADNEANNEEEAE